MLIIPSVSQRNSENNGEKPVPNPSVSPMVGDIPVRTVIFPS